MTMLVGPLTGTSKRMSPPSEQSILAAAELIHQSCSADVMSKRSTRASETLIREKQAHATGSGNPDTQTPIWASARHFLCLGARSRSFNCVGKSLTSQTIKPWAQLIPAEPGLA